jgi:uncharacterized membrane protein YbhN (UPF0104 family)
MGEFVGGGMVSMAIAAAATWVLGLSVGLEAGFASYAVALSGAVLLSTIPLSIAGWGVREMAFMKLMSEMGSPPEEAFAVSVIFGFCLLLTALPGAFLLGTIRDASPRTNDVQ